MNLKTVITLCISSLLAGMIFFAVHYELIIIRMPRTSTPQIRPTTAKRSIRLYYWNNNRWNSETDEIIWSDGTAENIYQLITRWLQLIDTEHILSKKVILEAAMLLPNHQDAYISFDQSPLATEWSTHAKWMFIEGLLKTIRENIIPIQHISFLEHHQPLQDAHLDFSNPWPITGFFQQ